MILGTVILFAVTEVLQGFVLTPIIIGSAIELHELTVLFAILVGGTTLGLWGIILALPAAAIIKILATEALLVRQT
jgi:predicted PurR-regulated permease PerM